MNLKTICAILAALFAGGCITVTDAGGGSRFYRSSSPTHKGEAIFTKHVGPQDSAVDFEVRDPKIGDKPIEIGFVGDANWQGKMPRAALWSKDGSVIAVQGADFKSWSHAYDFNAHTYSLSELYPPDKRAAAIAQLLKSRGGAGAKVLQDWAKFDQVAQPLESRAE